MPRFLSPEWVAAVDGAPAPDGVAITIGHRVTGTPDGVVEYRVRVAGGRLEASLGGADGADLVLSEDYETAAAINRGELSAQEAVAAGRLKLRGSVASLLSAGPALAGAADVLADLRAATTYD